jgi:hypothetical protein
MSKDSTLNDKLIAGLLLINFFISLIAIYPMISAWYQNLDEFQKGAIGGAIGITIVYFIIGIFALMGLGKV